MVDGEPSALLAANPTLVTAMGQWTTRAGTGHAA